MSNSLWHAWYPRSRQWGPWLLSLVLGACICLEMLRMALSVFASDRPMPQQPGPRASDPGLKPDRIDIQRIIGAHLFGVSRIETATKDPAAASASTANMLLDGTIATEDPKHGLAIISTVGGASKVYSVGQDISGASLYSVYLEFVLLDRNGSLEKLELERLASAKKSRTARAPATPAPVASSLELEPGPHDPTSLADLMRAEPAFDKDGKLRGFRVYLGRNSEAFRTSGFQMGDLVTAVNGTPLQGQDPVHVQQIFESLQPSGQLTVTVTRKGQPEDLMIKVAQ